MNAVTTPSSRPQQDGQSERAISFTAPNVRAVLDEKKTQSRRIISPQPIQPIASCHPQHKAIHAAPYFDAYCGQKKTALNPRGMSNEWCWWQVDDRPCTTHIKCPYGQPGDKLRVKEAAWVWCERQPKGKSPTGRDKWHYVPAQWASVHYAADCQSKPTVGIVSPITGNQWGWRLKVARFLPARASRTTLEIKNIRVERLQDISEEDAIAEGIEPYGGNAGRWLSPHRPGLNFPSAQAAYRDLWESLFGFGSWEANPYVWVISFKRLQPT